MNKYVGLGEPTSVTRDAGYSKIESISPENQSKIKKRIENPSILTGKYKIKEIFAKRGIVVIPERMSIWYPFTE
ncbi:MAG: hypothetical protein IJF83_12585 [Methanobrevibacter sp.]|nr:hypothetical protein [Methanobrevibacter sp.]